MIPIAKPWLGPEEAEAVASVLASGWIMQGPRVADFEAAVAAFCGARHAVAVSSGTAALHLALLAAGVGPGDEVVVPSLSFVATANAVMHSGAAPVFAEIDEETFNLDPDAAEAAITPRTRAIMPVHQIGLPADMDRFRAIGERRGVAIVEDAACALGSTYAGRPIGGRSPLACLSFHPRKVITTGEGGMVLTDDAGLAERVRRLRGHDAPAFESVAWNFRMTDVHAAIGLAQMRRLPEILSRRRAIGARYSHALAAHPRLLPPTAPPGREANFQSYAVRLGPGAPGRDTLVERLRARGVAAQPGVAAIHATPAYRARFPGLRLPRTESARDSSLLLPIYPTMTDAEQDFAIRELLAAVARPPP